MHTLTIEVPGKIIIAGEYIAVLNEPALVAAVNLLLKLNFTFDYSSLNHSYYQSLLQQFEARGAVSIFQELQVNVHNDHAPIVYSSEIPIGSGMGSSAALALAVSIAIHTLAQSSSEKLHKKEIYDSAYQLEKFAHGNPSGVDHHAIGEGGVHLIQKNGPGLVNMKTVTHSPLFFERLALVHTGTPAESTKHMVTHFMMKVKNQKRETDPLLKQMSYSTTMIAEIVQSAALDHHTNARFGELLGYYHYALEQLGVVTPTGQKLAAQLRQGGGNAKVSGAGGLHGGSGMMIAHDLRNAEVLETLERSGYPTWPFKVHKGLRYTIKKVQPK